ncbi:permease-like cell division protein FtsX [Actinomadura madurae]|uniref:Cell division transport system permease protein n=1 Tax=Actinomadura madurae TaxID=1993 RepID=A0A1I5EVR3_9ACTN|nr:permease-like cell division protein FtsX [Actinomadura madurae]SFO15121.1 cell division transport system permease protein [Actinomadura madurae]
MTEPEEPTEERARRAPIWLIAGAVVLAVALTAGASVGGILWMRDDASPEGSKPGEREVSVFFCVRSSSEPRCGDGAATEQQRQAVKQRVTGMPKVRQVVYESQQQAYERARKTFADRKDLLAALRPEDLPDSLRVRVAGTRAAEAVKAALTSAPGVQEVVIQPRRPGA